VVKNYNETVHKTSFTLERRKNNRSSYVLITKYFWGLMLGWAIIAGVLTVHDFYDLKRYYYEIARREAIIQFNKDQASRIWAASHGGVYVPITDRAPPNPFLSHIPNRDIG